MQIYAFIRKNNAFSGIFVLNFIKSNNLKVLLRAFYYGDSSISMLILPFFI
nr:MAG TPA: hypothetical protein [Caudoviricetes sp.]